MTDTKLIRLEHRTVIRLGGPDKISFLQGLVSNDVNRCTHDQAVYQTFLTPQGKFLHDFFMLAQDEDFLIDVAADRAADLFRRLRMYKLRADITLTQEDGSWSIFGLIGNTEGALELPPEPGAAGAVDGGMAFVDPRLAGMGVRLVLPAGTTPSIEAAETDIADYEQLRLENAVPAAGRDMIVEKSTLLECNIDYLNGLSWSKGCYMGQELTARTHYRGLAKKRLLQIRYDGAAPGYQSDITLDGKIVGDFRSGVDGVGLGLLRLDRLHEADDNARLEADGKPITIHPPAYAPDLLKPQTQPA